MVASENPVVLQCVVKQNTPVYVNHPAFTNGETMECAGVVAMVVFCSAADIIPQTTKFVGIIASDQTAHGTQHGHISVYVRGCVTMACDLGCLEDVRSTMVTIAFETTTDNPKRFVGTSQKMTPPHIVVASYTSCDRVIGTMVEKGRAPSNEIRVVLEPQRRYHQTQCEYMLRAFENTGGDPFGVSGDFTLNQALKLLASDEPGLAAVQAATAAIAKLMQPSPGQEPADKVVELVTIAKAD